MSEILRPLTREEEDSPYAVNTIACYLFLGYTKKKQIEFLLRYKINVYFAGISSKDNRVFIYSKGGETTYHPKIDEHITRVRIFEVMDEYIAEGIRQILTRNTDQDKKERVKDYDETCKRLGV